ncbi:hypothetical protein PV10_08154 [Exophiala mesophila]|uniref:Uncharacterized protein n=1 Tax=Exophiala mesophila TaxID=212818 RepID=A0A0D1XJV7_EXOME|nr:uncharacterized protein PV10_08154 [Exophiala mesophila]KIV88471.1 hypothetical protein PV10_08154 [Exophiala mesophila]
MPNLLSSAHDPVLYFNPDLESDLALACPSKDFISTKTQASTSFPPFLFEQNLYYKQYDMVPPKSQKRFRSSTLSTTMSAISPERDLDHHNMTQYDAEPKDLSDSEFEGPNSQLIGSSSFRATKAFQKGPRRSAVATSNGEASSLRKLVDNHTQTNEGQDEEKVIAGPSNTRGKQRYQAPPTESNDSNSTEVSKQARGGRSLVATPTKVTEWEGEQMHVTSSLRKLRGRTLQQLKPFQFDKVQHNLNTKGQVVDDRKMEEIMEQSLEKDRQTRSTGKRSRRLSSEQGPEVKGPEEGKAQGVVKIDAGDTADKRRKVDNQQRARSVSSTTLSCSELLDDPSRRDRTVLKVWLDGFSGGAAPFPLNQCQEVGTFVDRIIKAWDWQFNGAKFSYAIATFPWLTEDANIVIRTGMTESLQNLMDEVDRAPVWAEGKQARCEVKVTIYVE